MKTVIATAALLLAAAASPAAAQNIVTNGNFETAGLTSWTASGWGTNINGVISGAYSASTGCVGDGCIRSGGAFNTASGAYLYQDLATVAGGTYNLGFDYGAAGFTNELAVLFGNTTAFDQVNLTATNTGYTVTGMVATGAVTRLLFLGRQDPSYSRLDNVSVTLASTGAVPEPATWAMMIGGFGLVGGAMRRRGTKVAFAA